MIVNFELIVHTLQRLWSSLIEFSSTLNHWLTYEFKVGDNSYMLIELLFGYGITIVCYWVIVKFIVGIATS